jgi:hypothetical protein
LAFHAGKRKEMPKAPTAGKEVPKTGGRRGAVRELRARHTSPGTNELSERGGSETPEAKGIDVDRQLGAVVELVAEALQDTQGPEDFGRLLLVVETQQDLAEPGSQKLLDLIVLMGRLANVSQAHEGLPRPAHMVRLSTVFQRTAIHWNSRGVMWAVVPGDWNNDQLRPACCSKVRAKGPR